MDCCFTYIGFVRRGEGSSLHEEVKLEIKEEYEAGLERIEEFSHLIVLYHLHLASPTGLTRERNGVRIGVFATRSANRVNPIGVSVVELVRRDGNVLTVKGINALNGTPILDLKPYDTWDRVEKLVVPMWHNGGKPM